MIFFSIPIQWPKRTHTNLHHLQHAHSITSTTTRQTPTNESYDSSQNASNTINLNSSSLHLDGSSLSNNINSNSNNVNQTTLTSNAIRDSLKSDFIRKRGDIKFKNNNNNRSRTEKKVIDSVVSHSDTNSDKLSNGSVLNNHENYVSVLPTIVSHHKEEKKVTVKKSKYQDFDQSLVPDDGIFSSIMKVFGINQCPIVPADLNGPIEVDTSPEYLENVESRFASKVQAGGRYKPSECRARDKVAVIIPFRDRKQHLPILLKNLHPFLIKQQINYGIFLIEQSADGNFNRAKLFNVGFVEALKLYDWDCFIFHDVDLLPMDDRNLYTCPSQPRHLSVAVDTFGFK